ncbi:hypothetical protein MAHJHV50_50820 [Mycobacterium avium subsp. hominissuis]
MLGLTPAVWMTETTVPSPADYVMRTNAIGTLNVNEAFYAVAGAGVLLEPAHFGVDRPGGH